MIIVFEQVLLLLLFMAVGYALCKTKVVDSRQTKLLSSLCVYVFVPATVFRTLSSRCTRTYLMEKYPLVIGSAVVVASLALLAFPISRLLTKNNYRRSVYHYSLTIPNYGYIGYALAEGIFGADALLDMMMFSIPISCYTYTVGYCMLVRSKVSLKKLFNPINIAMLVGAAVGLLEWKVPTVAESFFAKAAGCMAPAGMLLIGMVISEYKPKELFLNKQAYVITFFRLLVIPCLVGWVLQLFSLEILLLPALLIMAMPCGSNTVIFPKLVGEDCKTGAALALITSILCCLTIPLCLFLFGFAAF